MQKVKQKNRLATILWIVLGGVSALVLSGCGAPDPSLQIPPQKWQDVVVEVQTRPAMVQPGMNEFLVLATLERGKPVYNLIVSVRTNESQPWRQAIQDGHSGVYRKALPVAASDDSLYVQLRKKRTDVEAELRFSLRVEGDGLPQ